MQVLLEREGPSQFFCSGIEVEDSGENNEDYYVDQEIPGETIGKYKQETSKSNSRIEKIKKLKEKEKESKRKIGNKIPR